MQELFQSRMNWDWLNLWLKTIEVLSVTNWSCLAFERVYPQKHSGLRDIMVILDYFCTLFHTNVWLIRTSSLSSRRSKCQIDFLTRYEEKDPLICTLFSVYIVLMLLFSYYIYTQKWKPTVSCCSYCFFCNASKCHLRYVHSTRCYVILVLFLYYL